MYRQSISSLVSGSTFSIAPGQPGQGIIINDMHLNCAQVIHYDFRVDLRSNHNVAFIIEHPVAVATIYGLHDATITGNRHVWDYYRAADREAKCRGLTPSSVLGLADGSIGRDIIEAMERVEIKESNMPLILNSVQKSFKIDYNDGNKLIIEPGENKNQHLEISVSLFDLGPLKAVLDPKAGLLDEEGTGKIKKQVLAARSAAVIGLKEEALYHALGDVVADIAGTGGMLVGKVEASLGIAYHKVTIGAVKQLHRNRLLQELN